jgi:hypothetical protein
MADHVKNSAAMKKMLELDTELVPKEINIYANHPNCISVQNEINKWSDY